MPKVKNKQKQDTPAEMMKRVFAVAELLVQTDRYHEIRKTREKTDTKTQKP